MNVLIGTLALGLIATLLLSRLRAREPERVPEVFAKARGTVLFLLPRLFVGLVGAGFVAALLPVEVIERMFGEGSGFVGLLLATIVGIVTPGGPPVAFAIGAAAFKAGAGDGPLIAYVTAWSLMGLNRVLVYEVPLMGRSFVGLRLALSLPVPMLLGALTMVI